MFRKLRAEEIECRVGSVWNGGFSLLLYKDARVDMAILDETVGPENWQREHTEHKGNLFCRVGIDRTALITVPIGIDTPSPSWVWKEDCGTESYTEKEKGEASDSFKRACVAWGIGRELYTAPRIYINAETVQAGSGYRLKKKNDAYGYTVDRIGYDDAGKINDLLITKNGKTVFELERDEYADHADDKITQEEAKRLVDLAEIKGHPVGWVLDQCQVTRLGEITASQYAKVVRRLNDAQ